jgi:hypothetical protein
LCASATPVQLQGLIYYCARVHPLYVSVGEYKRSFFRNTNPSNETLEIQLRFSRKLYRQYPQENETDAH